MSRPSHPGAMRASTPGRTRTAPPRMPDEFPGRGRYGSYMAFGAAAWLFLIMSLLVMRAAWALGSGPGAWKAQLEDYQNPIYIFFHIFAAAVLVWCGYRFLIKLFPKSQPPKIGPLPRPPVAVFAPLLTAAWIGASVLTVAILWGVFP